MHTEDCRQQQKPPDDPRQRSIDFARGEQLAVLQKCELPKHAKDKSGKGVRANVLKAVLGAIDHHGRGREGGCRASVATLAMVANIGVRTCTRAIYVLHALGLICITPGEHRGRLGSPTNKYTIVWSELDILVSRGKQQPATRCVEHDQSPDATPLAAVFKPSEFFCARDQSATGTDQTATGADQSATRTDQSATVAHKTSLKRIEAQQEAPSDEEADVGDDGARYFFTEEIAAVRAAANRLHQVARSRTPQDREMLLKVATLWHDGRLSENTIEQVLESFTRATDNGTVIRNRMAWFVTSLRNQCRSLHAQGRSERFEVLLATTDFPRELLAGPRPAAATT